MNEERQAEKRSDKERKGEKRKQMTIKPAMAFRSACSV
jgi:hypothetical protein